MYTLDIYNTDYSSGLTQSGINTTFMWTNPVKSAKIQAETDIKEDIAGEAAREEIKEDTQKKEVTENVIDSQEGSVLTTDDEIVPVTPKGSGFKRRKLEELFS